MIYGVTRRRLIRAAGSVPLGGLLPRPGVAAAAARPPTLRAVDLRCEHLTDPTGIDTEMPRVSWACEAARPGLRGLRQSAYRIVVASSPALLDRPDLWDSGVVRSDRSVLVPYAGRPLRSGQTCTWTVSVWDQDGTRSDAGAPASWSIGLLRPEDWQAGWIGVPDSTAPPLLEASWIGYAHPEWANPEPDHTQYFRRVFTLPAAAAPGGSIILVAADRDAAVFVDGRWAGGAEGWDTAKRIDLPALTAGPHVLAVQVGRRDGQRKPAALAARLEVACIDGQDVAVTTDAAWQCADWVHPDWKDLAFDATKWDAAKVFAPVGAAPWGPVHAQVVHGGPATWLRREVMLDRPVRRATAYLSGLGWSELWVNGRRVGDAVLSPGLTDYDRRVPYATHEIAGLLHRGANALGVVLGNGRFRAPRPSARDFGAPRMRLRVDVAFADGTTARILGDGGWQATQTGPIRRNNEYDGEAYDARHEMPGWSEAGFAASADWTPAATVPGPGGTVRAQMTEPTRVIQILQPVRVTALQPGGARVFDFGQNIAGVCRLHTPVGPAGAEIVLRHAERLRAGDGELDVENLRSARATDRFVLDGKGPRTFQPRFTTHGFRYAELSGPNADAAQLEACVVGDDLRPTGQFACSNPLLNRIYDAMAWSVRANCRGGVRTDCPQRDERQGWLGDPAESCRGEAMMFGNAAFYAKWLENIADTQRPDGSLSDVAPSYWPVYEDDVSWPSAFLAIPGMLLDQYGDRRPLETHYAAMERWIDHMRGFLRDDGAMPRDRWGDWGAPPEDRRSTHPADPKQQAPGALIGTAYFVHCLDMMARYAGVLGRDPSPYAGQASRLRDRFNEAFFDRSAGRYGNGDATSSILALAFDLAPESRRSAAAAQLVSRIEQAGRHVCFGLVGAQWVNRVLTALGRADLAYAMATQRTYPGLGYMIEQGATTLWELWNGDAADPAMNSGNHTMLMGDLPEWLYHHVAGIAPDPARPGYEHILIQPHPVGDLRWAEAEYLSPRGRIAVRWALADGRLTVSADVPPNAVATLSLPAGSRGRPTWKAGGSRSAPAAAPGSGIVRSWLLGSGRHQVETGWGIPF